MAVATVAHCLGSWPAVHCQEKKKRKTALLGECALQQLFEKLSLGKKRPAKEGVEQKKEKNQSEKKN